jgi:predicted nucleotidyltransferase
MRWRVVFAPECDRREPGAEPSLRFRSCDSDAASDPRFIVAGKSSIPQAMALSSPANHGHRSPPTDLIEELVRRIVAAVQPERIFLFGSAARGEMSADSDIDVLIVKSGVTHRRRLAQDIHLRLFGLGVPVDIIVVTPEDIEAFGDKVGTIIGPALRESREIYAAGAS